MIFAWACHVGLDGNVRGEIGIGNLNNASLLFNQNRMSVGDDSDVKECWAGCRDRGLVECLIVFLISVKPLKDEEYDHCGPEDTLQSMRQSTM